MADRLRADAKADRAVETDSPPPPSAPRARQRWAALIKRVWHVDPLEYPRGGRRMKIVSFINPWQQDVIEKILDHCGLVGRAPPAASQATPAAPLIRELSMDHDPISSVHEFSNRKVVPKKINPLNSTFERFLKSNA